jgi:predicted metal-binding protein
VSANPTTLLICVTCRPAGTPADGPPPGELLARLASETATDTAQVRVQTVRCLANCSRGLSAVIRREGAWTYVFGHLDASSDSAHALLEGARLLSESADGLLPWRGRPEPLKRGLIARVPPTTWSGEAS